MLDIAIIDDDVEALKAIKKILANIKIVDFVHDEICIEYPKELDFVAKKLETTMEETAAIYCKSLPIPAEAAVGSHWIH